MMACDFLAVTFYLKAESGITTVVACFLFGVSRRVALGIVMVLLLSILKEHGDLGENV